MNIDNATLQRLALQCETEDLQHCGIIMPHGGLLHVDARDQSISHASENVSSILGKTVEQLLGRPFSDCGLPIALSDADLRRPSGSRSEYAAIAAGTSGKLDVIVTIIKSGWLIEFWEVHSEIPDMALVARHRKIISTEILTEADIADRAGAIATAFREIGGFSRAMVYHFHDDWSGDVIAESIAEGLDGYLNLRFPASDIPKIARSLYLLNSYRHLPNADAPAVRVVSLRDEPLDLTHADLRGISPLHVKYLQNMGVVTSFSVPIIIEKALWGLLTCHHASTEPLSRAIITACVGLTRNYSEMLTNFLAGRRLNRLQRIEQATLGLHNGAEVSVDSLDNSATDWQPMVEVFGADGFAVALGGKHAGSGKLPPGEVIDEIDTWFVATGKEIFASSNLAEAMPGASRFAAQASGLYALRLKHARFYWFRQESKQKIEWAGEPLKSIVGEGAEQMLSPRASFKRWVEIKSGCSDPWRNEHRMVVAKVRDIAMEWQWPI